MEKDSGKERRMIGLKRRGSGELSEERRRFIGDEV